MSLCASCGMQRSAGDGLCPHHQSTYPDDRWAEANRIMCDLFHRGIEPQRFSGDERFDTNIPSTEDVTTFVYTDG